MISRNDEATFQVQVQGERSRNLIGLGRICGWILVMIPLNQGLLGKEWLNSINIISAILELVPNELERCKNL